MHPDTAYFSLSGFELFQNKILLFNTILLSIYMQLWSFHGHCCVLFRGASRSQFIIRFPRVSIVSYGIVSSLSGRFRPHLCEPSHTSPQGPRATFCSVGTQESACQVPGVSLHLCWILPDSCCQRPRRPGNVLEKSKEQRSLCCAAIYGFFNEVCERVCAPAHTHMHG